MTSTTTASPDVVAASRPWAAFALGQFVADHDLTFDQLDIRDEVTVWVPDLYSVVSRWLTEDVTLIDRSSEPSRTLPARISHTAHIALHGSCVQVTVRWLTTADQCCHDACTRVVQPSDGVEPGCLHGEALCAYHRHKCSECVDDRRQDRTAQ